MIIIVLVYFVVFLLFYTWGYLEKDPIEVQKGSLWIPIWEEPCPPLAHKPFRVNPFDPTKEVIIVNEVRGGWVKYVLSSINKEPMWHSLGNDEKTCTMAEFRTVYQPLPERYRKYVDA